MNQETQSISTLQVDENAWWDCPTCERPMPPENDKECHCGIRISHHLSVPTLCRRLRDAQQRESSLIVRNKKLEDEVNEQARLLGMSGERECDLRGALERERANTIHTCHDQCQKPMCVMRRERDEARKEIESIKKLLLDPNAVRINMLHGKIAKLDWPTLEHINGPHPLREQLAAERALADRLAEAANVVIDQWETPNWKLTESTATYMNTLRNTLTAWKGARGE